MCSTFVASSCLLVLARATALAQTAGATGGWEALMLSPFGALPPHSVSTSMDRMAPTELSLRYGRWEFTKDDAPHNTFGLTAARSIPMMRAQISVTGAYMWLQCGGCSNWQIVGVDLEEALLVRSMGTVDTRRIGASVGLHASLGASRNSDPDRSTARSAALSVPFGLGMALNQRGYLDVAVAPGFGYGRIAGPSRVEASTRSSLGGSVAWRLPSGVSVELGVQRVFLVGAPAQFGVDLSWPLGGRQPPH